MAVYRTAYRGAALAGGVMPTLGSQFVTAEPSEPSCFCFQIYSLITLTAN